MRAPLAIGRYVLHDEIASGGMASVHLGRLVGTGGFAKTVAIKRLHAGVAADPAFRTMILEEARLVSRIRHPNVVPPLDVLSEGDELLLVMEYVHGEALSRLLRTAWANAEPVPIALAASVLSNVLHGLHAAHEAKDERGEPLEVVHRDVSPQNVIIGVDGIARVIDFGIAKAESSRAETASNVVKGKLPYLAPEQLEGERATRRTDVYAAAVVFWEALAGRRLFEGSNAYIIRSITSLPVPKPSTHNPEVPAALEDIVLRGLARSPSDRFASAREMALAIEEAMHLATPTVVGAWVERLAAPALADRAKKIGTVEQSVPPDEEAAGGPEARPTPLPPARGLARRSLLDDPFALPPLLPQPSPLASGPPPPLPQPPLAANSESAPSLFAAFPVPQSSSSAGKPTSSGRAVRRYVVGLLALVILFGLGGSPTLLRHWVISSAAKQGVTLSFDRIELSRSALRFVDVHASSADAPGVALRSPAVLLSFRRFSAQHLVIDELEANLAGDYPALGSTLDTFRTPPSPSGFRALRSLEGISVRSLRIDWQAPFGPGTTARTENASVDIAKVGDHALGDDWRVRAPLVSIEVGSAKFGPWLVDLERADLLTRSTVRFDPTGASSANVVSTWHDDGSSGVSFAIPPASLPELGIPAAIFGGLATPATRFEARGSLEVVAMGNGASEGSANGPRTMTGHLFVAARTASALAKSGPVDLAFDLPITGDPSAPIDFVGIMSVAPAWQGTGSAETALATARIAGKFDVTGASPALSLAGKTSSIPCAKARSGPTETGLSLHIAIALGALADMTLSVAQESACSVRMR